MEFKAIVVGNYFMYNGNKYIKNSKCTSKLLENNRVFYFNQQDIIQVVLGDLNA